MDNFLTKEKFLLPAAIGLSLIAVIFWLVTSSQPLIDQHEFRQTQTAITSLYLDPSLKGLLNYETPVLGSPWSIPFEFPLYQLIVHALSGISPLSLDSSGRLTSSFFGLLCVVPAYGLMRLFQIKKVGRYWFLILYFSSPIYLYWNRTFMIESLALFLSLSSLYYYFKIRISSAFESRNSLHFIRYPLFFCTLLFSLLTKVTTSAPVFLIISVDVFFNILLAFQLIGCSDTRLFKLPRFSKSELAVLLSILILVFVMLKAWLIHADYLKSLNLIGQRLTSEALKDWNFGELAQRFDKKLWVDVVAKRVLNVIGIFPVLYLFAMQFLSLHFKKYHLNLSNLFFVVCLVLWISPLLIFTKLHIVHNYYQCANQVFLFLAIAASISNSLATERNLFAKNLILVSICLIVLGNGVGMRPYFNSSLISDSPKLVIGRFIQDNTGKDDVIFVTGNDWSSAFSYHSQRRSLTLPSWKNFYENNSDALDDSVNWLGGYRLGAIVEKIDIKADATNDSGGLSIHPSCASAKVLELDQWKASICSANNLN